MLKEGINRWPPDKHQWCGLDHHHHCHSLPCWWRDDRQQPRGTMMILLAGGKEEERTSVSRSTGPSIIQPPPITITVCLVIG